MAADLRRMGVLSGPAAPPTIDQLANSAADRIRQQQQIREELVRRGVVEGPKAPAAPATVAEEAQKRIEAITRGQAVQAEMARLGYGPSGALPPAGGRGRLGRALFGESSGGLAGLEVLASRAGGAGAVASWGMQAAVNVNRAQGAPYADPHQRFENSLRSLPLFGHAAALGFDFGRVLTGATKRFQEIEAGMVTDRIEAAGRAKLDRVESGPQLNETAMRERAKISDGFQLPRSANHDRGTVLGVKLAEEEARMLPIQEELRKAARERLAQQNRARLYGERAGDLEREAVDLERRRVAAMERRKAITERPVTGKVNEQAAGDALRQEKMLTQMARDKSQQAVEARQAAAAEMMRASAAKQRERSLEVAAARERYGTSLGREQTARSQAQRLGALGIEGRMRGQMALQLIRRIGIERAPAELQQQAALIAPETVAKMQEAAGKRLVPEMRRLGLGDEYRDTVDESAGRTREARENLSRLDEANTRRTAREQAEAVRGVPDAMKEAAGVVRSVAEALRDHFVREIEQLRGEVQMSAWWANSPHNR
jgi:hypothetical protein